MNLKELMQEIIPPNDFRHRGEGFSLEMILDKLTESDKILVEKELLTLLLSPKPDHLVFEALSYIKSQDALPILYNYLNKATLGHETLYFSSLIFSINNDESLVETAINSFKKLESLYFSGPDSKLEKLYSNDPISILSLSVVFLQLKKFNNKKTDEMIKKYINHSNFLISQNAKRILVKPQL